MQPTFNNNSRQRPLQKSMFLPSTQQYVHRNNSVEYQYQDMMKRPSLNPEPNKLHNYQINQTNNNFPMNQNGGNFQMGQNPLNSPIHQYNMNQNPILNFNSTPRHKQTGKLQPQTPTQDGTISQLQQKIEKLTQMVDNHEQIFKKYNLSNTQIQQIQIKLKDNVLPSLVNKQTKEIYQHIFNFKVQINSLKEQVGEINDKIKNQFTAFFNQNNNIKQTINTNQSEDKNEKNDLSSFVQLSTSFRSLQNRFLQIQQSLENRDDDVKSFILAELQKNKGDLRDKKSPTKFKQSTIQSTLNPIMLQYQQVFIIRNQNNARQNITKISLSNQKNNEDKQIIINSCTYYIDKQGFLLDNQNRYIVDAKGMQIKLDEKHLTLLKQHHVLN